MIHLCSFCALDDLVLHPRVWQCYFRFTFCGWCKSEVTWELFIITSHPKLCKKCQQAKSLQAERTLNVKRPLWRCALASSSSIFNSPFPQICILRPWQGHTSTRPWKSQPLESPRKTAKSTRVLFWKGTEKGKKGGGGGGGEGWVGLGFWTWSS